MFPVAGLGSRFLPATKATPKEMLPIVDKPLVQYAVEEAYHAGIREFIFITGKSKRAIEDHFDRQPELERELQDAGKQKLLTTLQSIIPPDCHFIYTRQPKPKGLGDAVLCAQALIAPGEHFVVILADDYLLPNQQTTNSTLLGMVATLKQFPGMMVATEEVPLADTKKYGIIKGEKIKAGVINCTDIVEKPDPQSAPSRNGIIGRYILPSTIFQYLSNTPSGSQGEIQLTDAIAQALQDGIPLTAFECLEDRFDCGSKAGYLRATIATALQHPELKDGISEYLAKQ